MITRRQFIVGASAVLGTTMSPLAYSAKSVSSNRQKLKGGYVKVLAALPYIYAIEKGIFNKYGIDVENIEFGSSNDVITSAITSQIDFVGAGATNAAIDAMTASGKILEIFTTNNYVRRDNNQSTDFLLALPEFKTMESLRGQPIAFFPGSFGRMFAKLVLPHYGLTLDDIKYVEMAPGQWFSAIQSKSVKAVTALEPFATKIMNSLPVNILINGYYATVLQDVPGSGSWFIKDHLSKKTEQNIFMAMKESIEQIKNNRTEVNEVIEKVFGLDKNISNDVRMMDWGTSIETNNREMIIRFGSILEESGGIARKLPRDNVWIWDY